MSKLLTTEEKIELAKKFNIEYKALNAVIKVECSGSGFDPQTGKIKIQFEPHHFIKYAGISISNGVESQRTEWEAYENAAKINRHAAMLSTSWGVGQIMGFNYKAAGFINVEDMVTEFMKSERSQLEGMLKFIASNKKMITSLRTRDWETFACLYNGPNYKKYKYDTALAEAYNS